MKSSNDNIWFFLNPEIILEASKTAVNTTSTNCHPIYINANQKEKNLEKLSSYMNLKLK